MRALRVFWCRRCAGLALAVAAIAASGCSDDQQMPAQPTSAEAVQSAVVEDASARWEARYYEGYFAEVTRGDIDRARAAYEGVIAGAGEAQARVAARAALRLAELEELAGRRRRAIELVARAAVLGQGDAAIVDQADRLQARLATAASQGSEVRGPPAGTPLEVGDAALAARFAAAEKALESYVELRLQPRLEALRTSVRAKQAAMEGAARAYREVADGGAPAAALAAEFRIGSLYHDFAVALMFDLPPELDAAARTKLRRDLRARAIGYLRKARTAYERSIEAAAAPSDRWLMAATAGRRAVDDLLGGE